MVETTKEGVPMTLGDRCDEIVRLIDETLLSVGAETGTGQGAQIDTSSHPSGSALDGRGRRPRPMPARSDKVLSLKTRRGLEAVVDRRRPRRPDTRV
jgi:hypothetical protein